MVGKGASSIGLSGFLCDDVFVTPGELQERLAKHALSVEVQKLSDLAFMAVGRKGMNHAGHA